MRTWRALLLAFHEAPLGLRLGVPVLWALAAFGTRGERPPRAVPYLLVVVSAVWLAFAFALPTCAGVP